MFCPTSIRLSRRRVNTDAITSHNQEPVQAIGIVSKNIVDAGEPNRQGCCVQPQENHAHVRVSVAHDQITKVPVISDENSPLGVGKRQNLVVSQSGSIVARDRRRIESKRAEMVRYPRIATLVNQKTKDTQQDVHAWAAHTPS